MIRRARRSRWPVFAALLLAAGCKPGSNAGPGVGGRGPADRAGPDDRETAPGYKINATTHFAAGRVHEREGNLLAAAEQYYRATRANPTFVQAHNRLGIVYHKLRVFPRAEAAFRRAIELAPKQAFLWNNLGFTRLLDGNREGAETAFRRAIELQPEYGRAHVNLGVVLAQRGEVHDAVAHFARVVPKDVAHYNVGVLLVAAQRLPAARQAFAAALACNPAATAPRQELERLDRLAHDPDGPARAELAAATADLVRALGITVEAPVAVLAPSEAEAAAHAEPVATPDPDPAAAPAPAATTPVYSGPADPPAASPKSDLLFPAALDDPLFAPAPNAPAEDAKADTEKPA